MDCCLKLCFCVIPVAVLELGMIKYILEVAIFIFPRDIRFVARDNPEFLISIGTTFFVVFVTG
jgi:hypothetical protein